jgi:hypothetical protein
MSGYNEILEMKNLLSLSVDTFSIPELEFEAFDLNQKL